jgi:hypothetical protein
MADVFKTIPLPTSDQPFLTQTTSLDDTPFRLRFDWNSRTDRWTFSLFLEDDTALLTGATLVADLDLLRTVSSDLRPGGQLRIVDFIEPTLEQIGLVSLVYLSDVAL